MLLLLFPGRVVFVTPVLTSDKDGRHSESRVSTKEGRRGDAEGRHHRPLRESHAETRGQAYCARRSRRSEERSHRRPDSTREEWPLKER